MFFVANKALAGGSVMTAFGPFATADEAVAMIEKFPMAGDYVVYGPADPVHSVQISVPVVASTPL